MLSFQQHDEQHANLSLSSESQRPADAVSEWSWIYVARPERREPLISEALRRAWQVAHLAFGDRVLGPGPPWAAQSEVFTTPAVPVAVAFEEVFYDTQLQCPVQVRLIRQQRAVHAGPRACSTFAHTPACSATDHGALIRHYPAQTLRLTGRHWLQ
jgi:hypothetical protein